MKNKNVEKNIDESEIKEDFENQEIDKNSESEIDKKEEKKLSEVELLKKEVLSWKEKAYQTAADCDNLRKSYEKDHANMLKYRAMGFVEKLLPVLDSFHLSLMVKPSNPELANYVKGFEMIYRQMLNALDQEGVKEISPEVGSLFDPETMQAVDIKDGEEDNKILQVYSNGYMLKDRLVRPAMVVVSKVNKPVEIKDEQKESEKTLN